MTTLDFDELHKLVDASLRTQDEDGVVNTIRDLLRNAYEQAVEDMDEEFEFLFIYYPEMLDQALEMPTEGLTWEQRVRSWYHGQNPNRASINSPEGGEIPPEGEPKEEETSEEEPTEEGTTGGVPDIDAIQRVAETEYHRMYNTGAYHTAVAMEESGRTVYKRWVTMGDEKVRSTHLYLDYEAVPLDEEFFTFDGDSALFPGDFSLPQNNINCRCWLEYETA